jgi:hypothetical protein
MCQNWHIFASLFSALDGSFLYFCNDNALLDKGINFYSKVLSLRNLRYHYARVPAARLHASSTLAMGLPASAMIVCLH